ncbi:MAG: hypothetical protein LBS82_00610 [Spirochaetaceae bacterium]|jgi:hypothetical protein|nr:hypothetical protein [Spirochaetaceae bacterium]
MKKVLVVFAAAVAIVFMGCASVNLPVAAAGGAVGAKTGRVEVTSFYLGLFGGPVDAGAAAAAKAGGITQIATVDTEVIPGILGLFRTFVTTVTGN